MMQIVIACRARYVYVVIVLVSLIFTVGRRGGSNEGLLFGEGCQLVFVLELRLMAACWRVLCGCSYKESILLGLGLTQDTLL